MALLLDSFWRAIAYCMRPRVVVLSVLPLLLMALMALVFGYFYWEMAVTQVHVWLLAPGWWGTLWSWLPGLGLADATAWVAPLLVVVAITPLVVLVALLLVAVLMTPALVALVAERRFATLERKKGGSFAASVLWTLGSTLLAVLALLLSMPLWLVPPLVLLLPPLIWGWLTYRVMAFDALAEHASPSERKTLLQRHRMGLLLIGVCSGYLGAAPALVWASGVVFVAGFFILIPLAIWIYTFVFAFSSLWFAHFCLAALERLRAEEAAADHPAAMTSSDTLVLPASSSSLLAVTTP
ncbi:EI24 domain-containing protein [Simplicispira psychrophila]|uniref:EI24 domain-containing protein n=1 Tax=Simplicispira psychrophila TaxID=80882 RepID=UPI000485DE7F|nr:EI24 domain-containing protein [Simplicispira psychrophila]